MTLLDGKALFNKIKKNLFSEVNSLLEKGARSPHLVAVLVGDDPASQTYVNAKVKACEEIGFQSTVIRYSSDVQEEELISKIHELNNDDTLDGLIVQLPLPKHIDESLITHSISYKKDVDGFHPVNIGRMVLGLPCYLPATPFGIITLLEEYDIVTAGKKCLVIGAETLSRVVDVNDRDSMIFADGAGATIIEKVDEKGGILSHNTATYTDDEVFYLFYGKSFNL